MIKGPLVIGHRGQGQTENHRINLLHGQKIIHIHACKLDVMPTIGLLLAVGDGNHLLRKIDADDLRRIVNDLQKAGHDGSRPTAKFNHRTVSGNIEVLRDLFVKLPGLS